MSEFIDKQRTSYDCAVIAVQNALLDIGRKKGYNLLYKELGTDKDGTYDEDIIRVLRKYGYSPEISKRHNYKGSAILAYVDKDGDPHVAFFKGKKGYNTFLEGNKPKRLDYVIKL